MKLQAGMAFECEINSIGVKGRLIENNGEFALQYKDAWGADGFFILGTRTSEVSYAESIIPTFKIIPITLDLLQVGDVIGEGNAKREVLGRISNLIFVSEANEDDMAGFYITINELKNDGYTVIQPEWEEKPKARGMTLREIEHELGYKIRLEEETP